MTSTPEPRWRRLPEERPQQILQAAVEVFDKKGLNGARLEDIAKVAGVSKGTIYLYFPNKEELFREMVRTTLVDTMSLREQIVPEATAAQQITNYIQQFWEMAKSPSYATIYRIIIGELHLFPDLADFYFKEVVVRSRTFVEGVVRRGIESGEFREVNPALAARMLAALIFTNAMWCRKRQLFPNMIDASDDEIRAGMIDFYLHALARPRA